MSHSEPKPHRCHPLRQAGVALSTLCAVVGAWPAVSAQEASAQPAPWGSDINTITRGNPRLASQLSFHQTTTLGEAEVEAMRALGVWVCPADAEDLPRTFSAFTRRAICRDETAADNSVTYRIAVNSDALDSNLATVVRQFTLYGMNETDQQLLALRAERIMGSLYMSNEGATALQIRAGVQQAQAERLQSGHKRDYAAIEIASEIASDARLLAQASNLIHEKNMPYALVVRMLNVYFPDGEGGMLLRTYEEGRDQPGYDPAATMADAMLRLWNPNSSNATVRDRVALYIERGAYPEGRPDNVIGPISDSARSTIITAALVSSGVTGFERHLADIALAATQPTVLISPTAPADVIPGGFLRGRTPL